MILKKNLIIKKSVIRYIFEILHHPLTLANGHCEKCLILERVGIGVFWATSKTRDNRRRFPGTAEKTLHGQSLESVSVEGTVAGGEGEDPLQWPGVSPPEVGPGQRLIPGVLELCLHVVIVKCKYMLCNS